MIRQSYNRRRGKNRPRLEPVWKVEPIAADQASVCEVSERELAAMLAAAFGRIAGMENRLTIVRW